MHFRGRWIVGVTDRYAAGFGARLNGSSWPNSVFGDHPESGLCHPLANWSTASAASNSTSDTAKTRNSR